MTHFSLPSVIRGANLFRAEALLRSLKPGQPLVLVRDRGNPVDGNAIYATTLYGEPVGYVAREHAAVAAPLLDAGVVLLCKVRTTPRVLLWVDGVPEKDEQKKSRSRPTVLVGINRVRLHPGVRDLIKELHRLNPGVKFQ